MRVTNQIVEVAVAEVKGFFVPSDGEREAAYELLVELTTRPSSLQLSSVDVSLGAELESIEEMFELTRGILRKHGITSGKGSGGNLSLAVIALRVLNEVYRPVVDRWRPLLDERLAARPTGPGAPTVADWERSWERSTQFRTELNDTRASTRAYVETLAHIAGTTAVADSVLSAPSASAPPTVQIDESLRPPDATAQPRRRMVHWFSPIELFRTWRSIARGEKSVEQFERRYAEADSNTHVPDEPTATFTAEQDADFWFDFVSDMGDGFDGTAPVAWMMGRRSLQLPDRQAHEIPTPPASMPRGELVVFGGDQVYPFASEGTYESQTELPFRMGLEGGPDGSKPTLVTIPANHDWMGGIEHHEKMFVSGESGKSEKLFAEHWRTVQDTNWFHVSLPQGWWIWGIDTGLHDRLIGPQHAYFRAAAERLEPGDRVILVTPVPLWQMRQKKPDDYAALRGFFDPIIRNAGATMPLCLAGDSHLFAHLERVNIDGVEEHITSGGGGAYTQPTHNLPERIPLERGNAEFKLTARWPLPADSRSMTPSFGRYLPQFWLLMVFAALVQLGVSALARIDAGRLWNVLVDDPDAPSDADPVPQVAATSVEQLGLLDSISWTLSSPWVLGALIALALAGQLVFRGNSLEPKLSKAARVYGIAAGVVLAAVIALVESARAWLTPPLQAWVSWPAAAVIGGIVGIVAFMRVVQWSNRRIKANDNIAFVPAQSTRFKHFLRFRIDVQGDLTCYAIGLDPVGKGWYDAMTLADEATATIPPYDPAGSPRLHYVWGRTYHKFRPKPTKIAISASPSDESKPRLDETIEMVTTKLIDGGHSLLYGGLPDAGLTAELHRIDVERHRNNPNASLHLVNYVAESYWGEDATSDQAKRVRVTRERAPDEGPVDTLIADLTAMRRLMTDDADIRFVIGGRLHPAEPGTRRAPGIIEEAWLALDAGVPLLIAGGFGGAAGLLAAALTGDLERLTVNALQPMFREGEFPGSPTSPPLSEMLGRFRSIGELRNGLTNGENRELLRTSDPGTVTSLVLRSVHRVAGRH